MTHALAIAFLVLAAARAAAAEAPLVLLDPLSGHAIAVTLVIEEPVATTAATSPCRVRLAWHDKWLVLPLLAAAGFRDAVSTIRTLAYVEEADEGNGVFAVVGADPRKNPRRFAYVKGGITGGMGVTTGVLMTSCHARTRVMARLAALGSSGIFVWAARHNDNIYEVCTRPGVVCRRR